MTSHEGLTFLETVSALGRLHTTMASLFAPVTLAPLLTTTPQGVLEPEVKMLDEQEVSSTLASTAEATLSLAMVRLSSWNSLTEQANADLDALKANMDQFFLIINGSIIILMQVFKHRISILQEITSGWLCIP